MILLSALIFIWLIIDPASLLGYTGCHIVGAASEGNIEECKEVAREYFAGPIGVFCIPKTANFCNQFSTLSYILLFTGRIYGVLGFIFYAGTGIGTMIVLCVVSFSSYGFSQQVFKYPLELLVLNLCLLLRKF